MPTNDFIGFASAGSANIMSQADYAAAHEQFIGVQPGMASSAMANKVWRQGANMAAVIGELIKNHGIDALDNGDLATLYNALLSATASTTLAGLMSAEDKIALDNVPTTYLPLSGGTMTGEIKTEYTSLAARTIADSELRISGGTGLSDGASVIVYGKDDANAGAFRLRAYNNHDLIGSSSGGLTWDGENLVPVSAVALSSQNTAVEYTNKLQLLSKLFGATNGSSLTFDRPFAQIPSVILCQANNLNGVMAPYDITTTGFKVYSSISISAYGYYLAIGQGV